MTARPATPGDAPSMARIYNQGIEDRVATFETRLRSADDIRQTISANGSTASILPL
jgi:L-amino acid N-acyltransferase YncA